MVFDLSDAFDGWDVDLDFNGVPDALENIAEELEIDVGPGSATSIHGWEHDGNLSGTPDLIESFAAETEVDLPLAGEWDQDVLNTGTPDVVEALAEELGVELPEFINVFNPHK
jgi:hypothetical protein